MRDFRRLEDGEAGVWSPELHGEYRRALTQREHALELAELEESPVSTHWRVPVDSMDDDALAAVARDHILTHAPLALPAGSTTQFDHLNTWVAALEQAGVMVLATGRGGVPVREMRGFSLHFEELPVIVVNGSDSARGRLFSLMHEYAHLLLHTGGLCDTSSDLNVTSQERMLEARCNAIAASVLMPGAAVLASTAVQGRRRTNEPWDYESLRDAAAPFGVSAEAFLRRLLTLGLVDRTVYQGRRQEFLEGYEAEEGCIRASGGNWYRNTARDLGKGYVRLVADAYRRRVIDSYTAASFLNVKVDQIGKLAAAAAAAAALPTAAAR